MTTKGDDMPDDNDEQIIREAGAAIIGSSGLLAAAIRRAGGMPSEAAITEIARRTAHDLVAGLDKSIPLDGRQVLALTSQLIGGFLAATATAAWAAATAGQRPPADAPRGQGER
jgi:hypothetical protein